jgi:hypothetical protein
MKKTFLALYIGSLGLALGQDAQFFRGWITTYKTPLKEQNILIFKNPQKILGENPETQNTSMETWAHIPLSETTTLSKPKLLKNTILIENPNNSSANPITPALLETIQKRYPTLINAHTEIKEILLKINTIPKPNKSKIYGDTIVETQEIQGPKNKTLVTIELSPHS